jgi:hypothetical protein
METYRDKHLFVDLRLETGDAGQPDTHADSHGVRLLALLVLVEHAGEVVTRGRFF